MGLLARFFKGSLLWSELWLMTWKEILWYYDNYELQITEEGVVQDLSYNKETGKKKDLPAPEKIRSIVNEKIAERRREINGEDK